MSGIVGVFQLDGCPVDQSLLAGMTTAIAHRGRDGVGHWLKGPVGLGQRMFHTTLESLQETQPLLDETGSLCLTLDGRVDNREELKAALIASGFRLRSDTDAELVLRAYECWGEACAARLIGDFAFVIWDGRRRQLFCVRDVSGIRPFYYYAGAHAFLCASELQALLADANVPRRPNEGMIGEYLSGNIYSHEETLFEDIKRLPPAHYLIVRAEGMQKKRYWDVDPAKQIRYRTDDEYAQHFLELFREAVRCRLRSYGAVAADLSGGLDSSSVVSMAQALIRTRAVAVSGFETFSLVFPGEDYDESRYIRAVVEKWGVNSTLVPPSPMEAHLFAEHAQRYQDFPGYFNGNIVNPLPALARAKGCRVNLNGIGGDDVFLGLGGNYREALRQADWRQAMYQVRIAFEGYSAPLIPRPWPYLRALPQRLPRLWRRLWGNNGSTAQQALPEWIAPEFAQRIQLADRLQTPAPQLQFTDYAQVNFYRILSNAWIRHAIEMEERALTWLGIEQRAPFKDRRIVEFCCAVPLEQRERKYLTRFALRQAMRGLLPEVVRRRRTKGSFDHLAGKGLRAIGGEARFHSLLLAAQGWVVSDKLRAMYRSTERYLNGQTNNRFYIWPLWMIYGIELWHNQFIERQADMFAPPSFSTSAVAGLR